MPGRKFVSEEEYRFGFNGVEDDRDWGTQNIQDYGFRLYNPSIGKFLSVDPLAKDYPELTCYQFASNTPLWAIDLDGLEAYISTETGEIVGQIGDNNMVRTVKAENVETVCLAAQNLAEKNPSFEEKALNIDYKGIADALSEATPLTTEELNVRVMLSVLRRTEGHGYGDVQPYDAMYPNTTFSSYKKHPSENSSKVGAGAYGIMGGYIWAHYKKQITIENGTSEFAPKNQDAVALEMINNNNKGSALQEVKDGRYVEAASKLKDVWTSLPGGSESKTSQSDFESYAREFRIQEVNGKSTLATPQGELKMDLDEN